MVAGEMQRERTEEGGWGKRTLVGSYSLDCLDEGIVLGRGASNRGGGVDAKDLGGSEADY